MGMGPRLGQEKGSEIYHGAEGESQIASRLPRRQGGGRG